MRMEISLSGGTAVDAHFKGHTVHTDQPEKAGGRDSGPAPFDLFLASIGTCVGYYAARFCELKGVDPRQMEITLETVRDLERKRVGKVRVEMRLPAQFPDKYRKAIVRAAEQCAVKRHILEPPEFEIVAA